MKIVTNILVLFFFIGISLFLKGDIFSFWDLPSFLFSSFIPLTLMMTKYGREFFNLGSSRNSHEIAADGFVITIMSGFLGTLLGFLLLLGNLSDQAALGPAMAVSILPLFYSVIFSFVIFFPYVKGWELN